MKLSIRRTGVGSSQLTTVEDHIWPHRSILSCWIFRTTTAMYRKEIEEESGIGSAVAVGLSPSLAAANTHLLFHQLEGRKQNLFGSGIGQLLPIPSSVIIGTDLPSIAQQLD